MKRVGGKNQFFSILNRGLVAVLLFGACATAKKEVASPLPESAPESIPAIAPGTPPSFEKLSNSDQIQRLHEQVSQLQTELADLQQLFTGINEKMTATQQSVDLFLKTNKKQNRGLVPHPAQNAGTDIPRNTTTFSEDTAIKQYREAMIIFDSEKYPEAVVAFSRFVSEHPDHTMAGSAQFHVGESYFRRGEYKLAAEEFQRVTQSYEKSSYVSDALERLYESHQALKAPEKAQEYSQLLLTLFPQSPAATRLTEGPSKEAVGTAQLTTPATSGSTPLDNRTPNSLTTQPQEHSGITETPEKELLTAPLPDADSSTSQSEIPHS